MAKKNAKKTLVILECTEARAEGKQPTRYYTFKNRQNMPDRMEKMKYNYYIRKHTLHREKR